jgi:hypothetical protein
MSYQVGVLTATIANGATVSDEMDLTSGRSLVAIQTPAALTGTALTFTACSTSGGTFVPVYDTSGNAVSVTVSTSRYIPLTPASFVGIRYLKVVSGSAEAAARSITLYTREV